MVKVGASNVCDVMDKAIQHIEREIKAKERRIANLRERTETLVSQNPDLAHLRELEKDIGELEDQLETDRFQLAAFQEEFAASCTP